jgi:hypothetical protein
VIKNKYKKIVDTIREKRLSQLFMTRLLNGIIFMAAFMVIGTLAPILYYNFFDNTNYVIQEVPFTVDKAMYKPCSTVRANFTQSAVINVSGVNVQELVLVRADKSIDSVTTIRKDSFIQQGDNNVTVLLTLPCDIEDGLYYWQGILSYEVHYVKKESVWHTERFLVEALVDEI